jgi:hypothetical protein
MRLVLTIEGAYVEHASMQDKEENSDHAQL